MDFAFNSLFADDLQVMAAAATLCAAVAAVGLRLYRRDFHGKGAADPDFAVLAAVCVAAACTGLLLSGSTAIAGTVGLAQSAVVAIFIMRDLRRRTAEFKRDLRRTQREKDDLATELDAYKAAYHHQSRKLAEVEPEAMKLARATAALDSMNTGVALFDRQQRLLYCNARFGEVHKLPGDILREGTPYQEILAARVRNGEFPGQSLDAIESWRRGELEARGHMTVLDWREDGRTIETSVKLLADGSRLATYTDVTDLRASMAKAAHLATSDMLTGLPNRKQFMRHMDEALVRMKRSGAPVATFLLDLDHFKAVNEALGLAVGDKLLQLVAERLRDLMRETDVIARIGNDRFAIMADGLNQELDAARLGQRVVDVLSVPYLVEGHHIDISASVGISLAPGDGSESDTLLRNADIALKRAKTEGRHAYRFFETALDARVRVQRGLEADLRSALSRGEFELFFQPILNVARKEVAGFEALLRWHHPEKGLLLPDAFLGFAEQAGLMPAIGRWVLREACACAAAWPRHLKLAVNLSHRELEDAELAPTIRRALASAGIAPDRLELDIPESAIASEDARVLETLSSLRDMNVRIALDDFGSGYASLTYLQAFPFDKLKIGRNFLNRDIGSEPLFMLRAAATLAEGLRIETTAKGVETLEQLDTVRQQRCTEAQGFLVSPPMPAQEVDSFLTAFNPKVLQAWSQVA